jgi:hypothetical protein
MSRKPLTLSIRNDWLSQELARLTVAPDANILLAKEPPSQACSEPEVSAVGPALAHVKTANTPITIDLLQENARTSAVGTDESCIIFEEMHVEKSPLVKLFVARSKTFRQRKEFFPATVPDRWGQQFTSFLPVAIACGVEKLHSRAFNFLTLRQFALGASRRQGSSYQEEN